MIKKTFSRSRRRGSKSQTVERGLIADEIASIDHGMV